MFVTIEILSKDGRDPNKQDIQENISTLENVLLNKIPSLRDTVLIIDTISILRGIQQKLEG